MTYTSMVVVITLMVYSIQSAKARLQDHATSVSNGT
jgi:hypothetical protein